MPAVAFEPIDLMCTPRRYFEEDETAIRNGR